MTQHIQFDFTLEREMTTKVSGHQEADAFWQASRGGILDGLMPALIPAYVAPESGRGGGECERESGTNFFNASLLSESSRGAKPFIIGMRAGSTLFNKFRLEYLNTNALPVEEWVEILPEESVHGDKWVFRVWGADGDPDAMFRLTDLTEHDPSATVMWSIGVDGVNGIGESSPWAFHPPDYMTSEWQSDPEVWQYMCWVHMTVTDQYGSTVSRCIFDWSPL